jgi:multimeric flavodoxin WrbA/putative sterol carrier protein
MKILVLRGNPRKDGNTQRITDLVVSGAREAGAQVDDVDLMHKKITPCIGCYHCWTVEPGKCRFDDDCGGLLELILDADVVLCSTPLYYYSVSSTLKTFLERTLPLTTQIFEKTPRGLMRNAVRYPGRWRDKRLGFVAAGAFKDPGNFEGLRSTFRLMADGFSMTVCCELVRPESYLLQFELAKPKTVKTVETALKRAGVELAMHAQVSEETQEKVSLPLSIDMPHFYKYSAIYWEHAMAMAGEAQNLAKVQRSVVADTRILMSEMARSIDPVASAKLRAVLQFDFPDKDLHYRLSVERGTCTIEETASDTCDLRVTVDTTVWAQVFTRQIDVRDALMQRKILLEGDKMLFTRLDRYFPPPVS